jgi:predicted HAD superfamily Cof-like phosphohydrolase
MNMFDKIVAWNTERGLIEKGFNHQKEVSFIIEELLESTGNYDSITAREKATEIALEITRDAQHEPEQIIDALFDTIIFATGAIVKLGYNPSDVMNEGFKEINSRTGTMVDGKFVKDPNAAKYTADFSTCKQEK